MGVTASLGRAALRVGVLLTAMLVSACAGLEPFQPRNDRVEGPKRGLFSGEAGEFVIYRRVGTGNGQPSETSAKSMAPAQVDDEPVLEQ
jgi:hypothetical protein